MNKRFSRYLCRGFEKHQLEKIAFSKRCYFLKQQCIYFKNCSFNQLYFIPRIRWTEKTYICGTLSGVSTDWYHKRHPTILPPEPLPKTSTLFYICPSALLRLWHNIFKIYYWLISRIDRAFSRANSNVFKSHMERIFNLILDLNFKPSWTFLRPINVLLMQEIPRYFSGMATKCYIFEFTKKNIFEKTIRKGLCHLKQLSDSFSY